MHLPALDFFRARICKTCDLEGFVGDCGCDFQTVNRANQIHFYPTMKKLVRSTFFRYFKVIYSGLAPMSMLVLGPWW